MPVHYLPGAIFGSKDHRSPKSPRDDVLPFAYLGLSPLYLHYVSKLGSYVLRYDLGAKELAISERRCATFACELDMLLGYDDWSEIPDDWSQEPEAAMPRAVGDCGIGFNLGGPGNLRKMEKITVESSDGFDMDVDRLYTWAPALDQVGHSVAEVGDRVNFIFRNSKSWMAAGIALRRVPFEEAQCIVKYVTAPLPCANVRNAAGCTTGPPRQRLIRMVEGTFGNHKGLMHELAHAFGQGRHNTRPQACPSVMGGPPGIWPTPSDISSTRKWAHS